MSERIARLNEEQYAEWLWIRVDGKTIPAATRTRASGACLQLAMEHHRSIINLIAQGLYGSAFALLRPAYESYVRGAWLAHCASDDAIARFVSGRGSPKIDRMLDAIAKVPEFNEGTLSILKRSHWNAMSEYTHSGALQVQRRQTDKAVESNYSKQEITEVTFLAETFGSIAAIGLLRMADDTVSAQEILSMFEVRAHDA